MHRLSTSFVLGYHGCDQVVADEVLAGRAFKASQNDYDWLGGGIYFWEANPQRGLDFAVEAMGRKGSTIKAPAVVGAVIDLGDCLDLTTLVGLDMLRSAYESLVATFEQAGEPLPVNQDRLRRQLDCAVIERLHAIYEAEGGVLDTVRGVFVEGEPVYPGAGVDAKTHIQLAVRNADCIKGVFRVPARHLQPWPAPPAARHDAPRARLARKKPVRGRARRAST